MYSTGVLGVSTIASGTAGVLILPNTGVSRVLLIVSVGMITVGTVMLIASFFRNRFSNN